MKSIYSLDFSYLQLPQVQSALHEFDRKNVARELLIALGNEEAVTEYRVRQLIEEAISSSVLEGARPTTREQARQLVRERRPPSTGDEQMILNNWSAMKRILELRDEQRPLVVGDVLEHPAGCGAVPLTREHLAPSLVHRIDPAVLGEGAVGDIRDRITRPTRASRRRSAGQQTDRNRCDRAPGDQPADRGPSDEITGTGA